MCEEHNVSFYMSTRRDETPKALQTFDSSNFFLSPDPRTTTDDVRAKLLFTGNRLSTPTTQHKLENSSKLCQREMKTLNAKKIFNRAEDFPPLM